MASSLKRSGASKMPAGENRHRWRINRREISGGSQAPSREKKRASEMKRATALSAAAIGRSLAGVGEKLKRQLAS